MDIAKMETIVPTNMRNVADPLRKLRQQRKSRLLRQQMNKLRRPKVILLQKLFLPFHLVKARERIKERERAKANERSASIDKYWLV